MSMARDLDGWSTDLLLYRRWRVGGPLAAKVNIAWMLGNIAHGDREQQHLLNRAALCARLFPQAQVHVIACRGALMAEVKERPCPTP